MAILRRSGVIIKRNGEPIQPVATKEVIEKPKRNKPLTREALRAALARLNDNLGVTA